MQTRLSLVCVFISASAICCSLLAESLFTLLPSVDLFFTAGGLQPSSATRRDSELVKRLIVEYGMCRDHSADRRLYADAGTDNKLILSLFAKDEATLRAECPCPVVGVKPR